MSILTVPVPPTNTARLRFVTTTNDPASEAIRFDTRGDVSHAEAVMADGSIIGSYFPGGVMQVANDHDKTSNVQIFVDLHMPEDVYKTWSNFLKSKIGEGYDDLAIFGFVTDFNLHEQGRLICSALQVDALRHCKWFPVPLTYRYHMISPAVLLLMLQADPRSAIHPKEQI